MHTAIQLCHGICMYMYTQLHLNEQAGGGGGGGGLYIGAVLDKYE